MSPAMMGGLGGAVLLVITCVLVAVFVMRRRGQEEGVYDDPAIVVAKIRAAGSLSMYNPAYDPTPGRDVRSDGFGSPTSNHGSKGPWDEGVTTAYGERAMDTPLCVGPQDEP